MSPVKKSPAELRKEKQEADARLAAETGSLPPGVEPGESLDPFENPKVGEQDIPVEMRTDGRHDGIRDDQMDGVQAAADPGNDLDQDEEVERNMKHQPNPKNRDAARADGNTGTNKDGDRNLSARTQEEVSRGKDALSGRKGKKASA